MSPLEPFSAPPAAVVSAPPPSGTDPTDRSGPQPLPADPAPTGEVPRIGEGPPPGSRLHQVGTVALWAAASLHADVVVFLGADLIHSRPLPRIDIWIDTSRSVVLVGMVVPLVATLAVAISVPRGRATTRVATGWLAWLGGPLFAFTGLIALVNFEINRSSPAWYGNAVLACTTLAVMATMLAGLTHLSPSVGSRYAPAAPRRPAPHWWLWYGSCVSAVAISLGMATISQFARSTTGLLKADESNLVAALGTGTGVLFLGLGLAAARLAVTGRALGWSRARRVAFRGLVALSSTMTYAAFLSGALSTILIVLVFDQAVPTIQPGIRTTGVLAWWSTTAALVGLVLSLYGACLAEAERRPSTTVPEV